MNKKIFQIILFLLPHLFALADNQHTDSIVAFQYNANVGVLFGQLHYNIYDEWQGDAPCGGPTFDMSAGVRILDFVFIGGGVGYHTSYSKISSSNSIIASYLPIYGVMETHLTGKKHILYPTFGTAVGGYVGLPSCLHYFDSNNSSKKIKTGLEDPRPWSQRIPSVKDVSFTPPNGVFVRLGVGLEGSWFYSSIGMEVLVDNYYVDYLGYFKLGIHIETNEKKQKKSTEHVQKIEIDKSNNVTQIE